MNFTLELVSGPDIEPLTLAEMKRHLKCFDSVTAEDGDIQALISGSRAWVEDYTSVACIDQTWRLTIGNYVSALANVDSDTVAGRVYRGSCTPRTDGSILLRRYPALAIVSFKSVDAAGAETVIDPATYQLREADSKWPRIVALNGGSWNSGTFRIEFRAGFADRVGSPNDDASVVPVQFKQAMKLWAESNYDRNEDLLGFAERLVKLDIADLQFA